MIRQLEPSSFPIAAEVIRTSFATVAEELNITEQNCPKYVGFVTTTERLQTQHEWGWWLYGFYKDEQLVGYVSVSKAAQDGDTLEVDGNYEIHNLAVLPECRHMGYGRQLLYHCVSRIREFGGNKIIISIVEENTVLKNWYTDYGFRHTGTKKYEHLPFTSGYLEMEVR